MSTKEEVEVAIDILGSNKLTIMHCNSSYPANEDELDLLVIRTLIDKYPNSTIGYSGHEKGVLPTIIAASMGAKIIERHITIDKKMWGTDHNASLTEDLLTYLIEKLKNLDRWLGSKKIKVYESEKEVRSKLRKKTYEEGDNHG
jgi:N-acetylneuraminate synthase